MAVLLEATLAYSHIIQPKRHGASSSKAMSALARNPEMAAERRSTERSSDLNYTRGPGRPRARSDRRRGVKAGNINGVKQSVTAKQ